MLIKVETKNESAMFVVFPQYKLRSVLERAIKQFKLPVSEYIGYKLFKGDKELSLEKTIEQEGVDVGDFLDLVEINGN